MKNKLLLVLGILLTLAAYGCAKYAPPLAPEKVSPVAVPDLLATPRLQGILFTWSAPGKDQRGRELKQIDGYRIYRKTIEHDSDIMNREVEFELLDSIADIHLAELDKLRKAAEAENKPTRRIRPDSALTKFEYTDTHVVSGRTYLYKIVPYNQGDVEGAFNNLIKITFKGRFAHINPYHFLSRIAVDQHTADKPTLNDESELLLSRF